MKYILHVVKLSVVVLAALLTSCASTSGGGRATMAPSSCPAGMQQVTLHETRHTEEVNQGRTGKAAGAAIGGVTGHELGKKWFKKDSRKAGSVVTAGVVALLGAKGGQKIDQMLFPTNEKTVTYQVKKCASFGQQAQPSSEFSQGNSQTDPSDGKRWRQKDSTWHQRNRP